MAVRRRFVYDEKTKAMVEVSVDRVQAPRGTLIMGDIPEYVSPVTGQLVSGRKQRREDLKRTGSRPWEGMESERKHSAKLAAEVERRNDATLDRTAREVFNQLPPSKRRLLEGR